MRKTYQYNRTTDEPNAYGHSASETVKDFINYKPNYYSAFSDRRGIEDQVETLAEVTGNLCDLLVSKGVMNHQEFLQILGLDKTHEGRDVPIY